MRSEFVKWDRQLSRGSWDVEQIDYTPEGLVFLLVPDGPGGDPRRQSLRLCWDWGDLISYQVTDESYRADCWGFDFDKDGRIYLGKDSEELACLRGKSPLVPEETQHFLLVGSNTVVDVFAKGEPQIQTEE